MTGTEALRTRLSGWAGYPVEECRLHRPESKRDLSRLYARIESGSYISRGLGRSYGDASLNDGENVVSHLRMNRFLAFDADEATLDCESGVSIGDIIRTFAPRGYLPPVIPGTRHVTVGGAIAADIHGKNHHVDGSFGDWVLEIELMTPGGERIACSPTENPEIFDATIGGMGLTGAITRARIQLREVPSTALRVRAVPANDLDELLDQLERADSRDRYTVAWLDCLARGTLFGRGIVLHGDHPPEEAEARALELGEDGLGIPFTPPFRAVRVPAVRAFNAVFHRFQSRRGERFESFDRFFFPLDTVDHWHRLYGPRGFLQYQVVLPTEAGVEALRELLSRIRREEIPVFLAVLKRLGQEGRGALSFPMPGHTLAIDMPRTPETEQFVRETTGLIMECGGRVYLAKDALTQATEFDRMYPAAERLRTVREMLDPHRRISSSLSRRVGLDDD